MWLLSEISLPYLASHKLRTTLALVGIAIGVAAIVGTHTVTDAVFRSFQRTVEATAGHAELQLSNGRAGVPEELLERVTTAPGVAAAAPLVEGFVSLADAEGEMLAVFGLDLLGDAEHEAQVARSAVEIPDALEFVNQLDSAALPRAFAKARGYHFGSVLDVFTPKGRRQLVVRGLVDATGPATLFGGMVGLMDLPAAQRLLAKEGKFDRIDVRVRSGVSPASVLGELQARAHGLAHVEETAARSGRAQDLLVSLRVALALAGLVASVVGFFIIYHTATVAVTQRRREIALLNALGVSERAILVWLIAEATVLGSIAAVAGFVIGLLLARVALSTVGPVVSVWVRLPIEPITVSGLTLLFAAGVGLTTTLIGTLLPAWSAVSRPSARLLHLVPQTASRKSAIWRAVGGAVTGLAGAGALLALAPTTLPYTALVSYIFGVNCLALVSFALLSAPAALVIGRLITAGAARVRGVALLLAGSAVARNPAGPVAVVAAIVMGLGWTLADASLIESLKRSWLGWLDQHYRSDLVVSGAPATVSFVTSPPISDTVLEQLRTLPGVRHVQGVRVVETTYGHRPAVVEALDQAPEGLPLLDGPWEAIADAFWRGAGAVVNSKLAHLAGLQKGDTVNMPTPSGEQRLPILGVFSDFQNGDMGSITVSRTLYRQVWRDQLVSAMFVWTAPGIPVGTVQADIQRRYGQTHGLYVVTVGEFRQGVAALVENVFKITYALVFIALVISFVGVTNFLLAAVLDREGEFRTLRAVGISPLQIRGAIIAEGGLVGVVGVALGMAAGAVVSRIIVLHSVPMVNGWHFQYAFPTTTAVGLCLSALTLAAVAGLLPARLATRRRLVAEGPSE